MVCMLEFDGVPLLSGYKHSGTNFSFDRIGGGWSRAWVPIFCLLLSCQALEAHASPKRNRSRRHSSSVWNDDPDLNRYTTHLTDLAWPILQNLGFSGAVGLVCAVAFKVLLYPTLPDTATDRSTGSFPGSCVAHWLT